jgi:hypothetical protein
LAELQERVALVPQVLARQAQRDAPEVRWRGAAAPLQVPMGPQLPDAGQWAVLVRIRVQRAARARPDEPRQERLQQALRAEAR